MNRNIVREAMLEGSTSGLAVEYQISPSAVIVTPRIDSRKPSEPQWKSWREFVERLQKLADETSRKLTVKTE